MDEIATVECRCGVTVTADDDAGLHAAMRAHVDAAQPELKLTDAQIANFLDARARLAPWDGERRPLTEPVTVRPLTPGLREDWLRFFDRDAFMDNPTWADCYRRFYLFPGDQAAFNRITAAENRADMDERIARRRARGYLAYADETVIGWCHAAPRAWFPRPDAHESAHTSADGVGSMVCFVVAAPYRGQGVARHLLDAACDGLRESGSRIAEAYPRRDAEGDAASYHGPLPLYLAAGFTAVREDGDVLVVRKPLA